MKLLLTPPRPKRPLPPHVHTVTMRGREYFYFQIGRSTGAAGPRIKISDPWSDEEIRGAHEASGVTFRGMVATDWKAEVSRVFISAKVRAGNQKLEFGIDRSFLTELLIEQGHRCAISRLFFDTNGYETCHAHPFAMSIDRIDSNGGYTKSNVRLVCFIVNVSLGQWGLAAVERMAVAIASERRRKLEKSELGKPLENLKNMTAIKSST